MLGNKLIEIVDRSFRNGRNVLPEDKARWQNNIRDRIILNYDYYLIYGFYNSEIGKQTLDDLEEQTVKVLMSDIC
jgi:hypothetical protein